MCTGLGGQNGLSDSPAWPGSPGIWFFLACILQEALTEVTGRNLEHLHGLTVTEDLKPGGELGMQLGVPPARGKNKN